jgi:hypothetical protein
MRHLDRLVFHSGRDQKEIESLEGELTELSPADLVDVLVVSAFPGDYIPTPTSLIGALAARGVSVGAAS